MNDRPHKSRSSSAWFILAFTAGALVAPAGAHAQFLRLGPFDFTARARASWIYTTNVEQERESEAKAERKDSYYVVGLDLNSQALLSPRTKLDISTGVSVEKHQNRPDLDNSSSPFGHFQLSTMTELPPWALRGEVSYLKQSQSGEDTYVPGGRKIRDPNAQTRYSIGPSYTRERIHVDTRYDFLRERHDEDQFRIGDKDQTTITIMGTENLTERFRLIQEYTKDDTELVETGLERNETKYRVGFSYMLTVHPDLSVGAGFEKDETETNPNDAWDPYYRVELTDDRELSPRLHLRYSASYTQEKKEEADDIKFQYGAELIHNISYSAVQRVYATREPRATFGSTAETDTSTVGYRFTKSDLFIHGLNASAGVSYETDTPLDGPKEKITTYNGSIYHRALITRRLDRRIAYDYSLEEDSLYKNDPIEEHRFTIELGYEL